MIDIGLPSTVDNAGLPTFYIPDRELGSVGATETTYAGIRLRVNKGASLVILADNTGYIETGVGHSCPTGYFKGGTVEVMAGGKLRDGAYEGFPLGDNAVLLNRNGSYLGIGPQEATDPKVMDAYNKYYSGWLIGPQNDTPRIEWDDNAGYIEVRPGKLAITANVTVKKSLGLIYSVWFVGAPTVTIDTKGSLEINEKEGLFANGPTYKFYGTTGAKIIIKPGSTLHQAFLTTVVAELNNLITVDDSPGSTNREPVLHRNMCLVSPGIPLGSFLSKPVKGNYDGPPLYGGLVIPRRYYKFIERSGTESPTGSLRA